MYVYIWKEIKIDIHTLFLNYKATNFQKKKKICSKHLPSIAYYYSQKYFTFTKFSRKKKVL